MKQRIIVQAYIAKENSVLLLCRSQGRPSMIGKYELPGGRIEANEQPDEAIKRHIQNDTGFVVDSLDLIDALSFTGLDEESAHIILLVYKVRVQNINKTVQPGRSYSKYVWQSMELLHQLKLRDSTQIVIDSSIKSTQTGVIIENKHKLVVKDTTKLSHVIIYSDGGSRGNPGPSSAGYVIMDREGTVIDEGGLYLGITTNNLAEYQGVRIALEHAFVMGIKTIEFRLDSLLVVNQMRNIYKIKNRELWPVNELIRDLIKNFDKVSFVHVPRELNQKADALVNQILDKHQLAEG